jgi:hypothetical protein
MTAKLNTVPRPETGTHSASRARQPLHWSRAGKRYVPQPRQRWTTSWWRFAASKKGAISGPTWGSGLAYVLMTSGSRG